MEVTGARWRYREQVEHDEVLSMSERIQMGRLICGQLATPLLLRCRSVVDGSGNQWILVKAETD